MTTSSTKYRFGQRVKVLKHDDVHLHSLEYLWKQPYYVIEDHYKFDVQRNFASQGYLDLWDFFINELGRDGLWYTIAVDDPLSGFTIIPVSGPYQKVTTKLP